MWGHLSTMENTELMDGSIDKSYIKLKTTKIYNAMGLTLIQSFLFTVLWLLTKSSWSIIFHLPLTWMEVWWFYREMKKGWNEEYWEMHKIQMPNRNVNRNRNRNGSIENGFRRDIEMGDELSYSHEQSSISSIPSPNLLEPDSPLQCLIEDVEQSRIQDPFDSNIIFNPRE